MTFTDQSRNLARPFGFDVGAILSYIATGMVVLLFLFSNFLAFGYKEEIRAVLDYIASVQFLAALFLVTALTFIGISINALSYLVLNWGVLALDRFFAREVVRPLVDHDAWEKSFDYFGITTPKPDGTKDFDGRKYATYSYMVVEIIRSLQLPAFRRYQTVGALAIFLRSAALIVAVQAGLCIALGAYKPTVFFLVLACVFYILSGFAYSYVNIHTLFLGYMLANAAPSSNDGERFKALYNQLLDSRALAGGARLGTSHGGG